MTSTAPSLADAREASGDYSVFNADSRTTTLPPSLITRPSTFDLLDKGPLATAARGRSLGPLFHSSARSLRAASTEDAGFWPVTSLPSTTTKDDQSSPFR